MTGIASLAKGNRIQMSWISSGGNDRIADFGSGVENGLTTNGGGGGIRLLGTCRRIYGLFGVVRRFRLVLWEWDSSVVKD